MCEYYGHIFVQIQMEVLWICDHIRNPIVWLLCTTVLWVNKLSWLSLQCGTPSEIVLYVRFFKSGVSHLNAVLFLSPILIPILWSFHSVHVHSSSPPSSSPLCLFSNLLLCFVPPITPLSLSLFLPLLSSCLISAVSVCPSTTPCRRCNDAVLAASQTVCPLAPPPPHTSLPPDAINTKHRWVIAETYRLPPPDSPV